MYNIFINSINKFHIGDPDERTFVTVYSLKED